MRFVAMTNRLQAASLMSCSGSRNLRVRVSNFCQIGGSRAGIQVRQQTIVAPLALELGHAAIGVVDIAENDGLRRTGLLAGRLDLAVADEPIFFFGIDFRLVDALQDRKSVV